MPAPALALLLGLALAACSIPLPWSALSPLPLALILVFLAVTPTARGIAGRAFWVGFGYFGLHLWWLGAFLVNLLHFPPLALLAGILFALEGIFLAVMVFCAAWIARTPRGRVWTLAGGWVLLEWLRFLGPLAFPWPTLGYTLLPTPAIQIADLGGVLLGSVLVAGTAAALAHGWLERGQWGRRAYGPALLAALAWAFALAYGLTRTPGVGPEQPMRVMRVTFDAFSRAAGNLSSDEQFQLQKAASLGRPEKSVVVWSETALTYDQAPTPRPDFPGPGISGAGGAEPIFTAQGGMFEDYNTAVSLDATGKVTARSNKAKLVPFGEEYPLQNVLGPVYRLILAPLGLPVPNYQPNTNPTPLHLNGVQYGVYICYDSVFPWVARRLAGGGAQVLVNPSNDGWYQGWGVQQHFNMGRVRAIETRRWLVRSVNNGVAGAVNDLGQPVQTIADGSQLRTLDVRPRLLSGTTLYMRVGDSLALVMALGMVVIGATRRERLRA